MYLTQVIGVKEYHILDILSSTKIFVDATQEVAGELKLLIGETEVTLLLGKYCLQESEDKVWSAAVYTYKV